MPGVWLLVHAPVPYAPFVCVFASRRSYGHAAAPSCASASSSEMMPSTVTAAANAHSKSPTALLTISAAFVGLSKTSTGTRLGALTPRYRSVLHATKSALPATSTQSHAPPAFWLLF